MTRHCYALASQLGVCSVYVNSSIMDEGPPILVYSKKKKYKVPYKIEGGFVSFDST